MAISKLELNEILQGIYLLRELTLGALDHIAGFGERLSANIEINLYRVVQELINNIIKHAEATEVEVQLYKSKNHLIIMVEDNGKGFNINEASKQKGMGISNIKSRLRSVKGEISFEKAHDSGTLAIIKVPILI